MGRQRGAAGRRRSWAQPGAAGRPPWSVEAASVAADLAARDPAGRIDDEVARAAVRAAVRSVGAGRTAPESAHCDGAAHDRRGGGSRSHSCVPSGRAPRERHGCSVRRRGRSLRAPRQRHATNRSGGFRSGAAAGAGWARPAFASADVPMIAATLVSVKRPHGRRPTGPPTARRGRRAGAAIRRPLADRIDGRGRYDFDETPATEVVRWAPLSSSPTRPSRAPT